MANPENRLKKLSGLPKQVTKLVENESDRGTILILASYLEELLSELIFSSCATDKLAKEILDFRKPAGDFRSKILLCEAFSLIERDEAAALNAIRKIRNRAAHFDKKSGEGFDVLFDSNPTQSLISNLAAALNLRLEKYDNDSVRALFVVCCRLLAVKVLIRGIETQRPKPLPSIKEVANQIRSGKYGREAAERSKIIDDLSLEEQVNILTSFGTESLNSVEPNGEESEST